MDLHVVVLAAGKGTRMNSAYPKVLHRVGGRPMIEHVLDRAHDLSAASTTVVIGHLANELKDALASRQDLTFVVQEPQLGTAHALLAAESSLASAKGTVILLSGDVPLLTNATLRNLLATHRRAAAAMTIVTTNVDRPHGYGRIVRSGEKIARIVEERMPPRPNARSGRSIPVFTHSNWTASLIPSGPLHLRTHRANTTFLTSSRFTGSAAEAWKR